MEVGGKGNYGGIEPGVPWNTAEDNRPWFRNAFRRPAVIDLKENAYPARRESGTRRGQFSVYEKLDWNPAVGFLLPAWKVSPERDFVCVCAHTGSALGCCFDTGAEVSFQKRGEPRSSLVSTCPDPVCSYPPGERTKLRFPLIDKLIFRYPKPRPIQMESSCLPKPGQNNTWEVLFSRVLSRGLFLAFKSLLLQIGKFHKEK